MKPVDIIIPTLDNLNQLLHCILSIAATKDIHPFHMIIVNNGDLILEDAVPPQLKPVATVLTPGQNTGWTGGLIEGLKQSDSEYVLFANDDIYIPRASRHWLHHMVELLDSDPTIGAIGPTSNCVTGGQNIWSADFRDWKPDVQYLIGFCILVRRKALDEAGGVQHMEHGGDDFDLSIRLRKAGYRLTIDQDVFVYHHGFQTGQKVYGKSDKPNGWNSREMIDNTRMELIRKHGFLAVWRTITGRMETA